MKLIDWLPHDAEIDKRLEKHLSQEVLLDDSLDPFPQVDFKYRNIHNWCLLENGYAVGWNESPRNGWTFVLSTPKTVKQCERKWRQ